MEIIHGLKLEVWLLHHPFVMVPIVTFLIWWQIIVSLTFKILVLNLDNVIIYQFLLLHFILIPIDIPHPELRVFKIVRSVVKVESLRNLCLFEIQKVLHYVVNMRRLALLFLNVRIFKEYWTFLAVNSNIHRLLPACQRSTWELLRMSLYRFRCISLVLHINWFLQVFRLWLMLRLLVNLPRQINNLLVVRAERWLRLRAVWKFARVTRGAFLLGLVALFWACYLIWRHLFGRIGFSKWVTIVVDKSIIFLALNGLASIKLMLLHLSGWVQFDLLLFF
jgi:hypothetical protein